MAEFRFSVGHPERRRSTVWKIWSRKNDVYIQSRMMGCDAKVSLHGSGICQWSLTDEWVEKAGTRNADRHIVRWQRAEPTAAGATHLFRIVIPESELCEASVEENIRKVTWIKAPPFGYVTLVELYLTPPMSNTLDSDGLPYHLLTSFQLSDSKWLVALMHQEPVTAGNAASLRNARDEILRRMDSKGIELSPQFRAVAFLEAPNGARGIIELVPMRGEA